MASTNNFINELTGTVLVLSALLSRASAVDCHGKSFQCVNSTHFMICVDLGGGVSQAIDDFYIACPPPTVCQGTNHFECEFPAPTTPATTLSNVISETTLPWEEIVTVSSLNNTTKEFSENYMDTTTGYGPTTAVEYSITTDTTVDIAARTVSDDSINNEVNATEVIPYLTMETTPIEIIPFLRKDRNSTEKTQTAENVTSTEKDTANSNQYKVLNGKESKKMATNNTSATSDNIVITETFTEEYALTTTEPTIQTTYDLLELETAYLYTVSPQGVTLFHNEDFTNSTLIKDPSVAGENFQEIEKQTVDSPDSVLTDKDFFTISQNVEITSTAESIVDITSTVESIVESTTVRVEQLKDIPYDKIITDVYQDPNTTPLLDNTLKPYHTDLHKNPLGITESNLTSSTAKQPPTNKKETKTPQITKVNDNFGEMKSTIRESVATSIKEKPLITPYSDKVFSGLTVTTDYATDTTEINFIDFQPELTLKNTQNNEGTTTQDGLLTTEIFENGLSIDQQTTINVPLTQYATQNGETEDLEIVTTEAGYTISNSNVHSVTTQAPLLMANTLNSDDTELSGSFIIENAENSASTEPMTNNEKSLPIDTTNEVYVKENFVPNSDSVNEDIVPTYEIYDPITTINTITEASSIVTNPQKIKEPILEDFAASTEQVTTVMRDIGEPSTTYTSAIVNSQPMMTEAPSLETEIPKLNDTGISVASINENYESITTTELPTTINEKSLTVDNTNKIIKEENNIIPISDSANQGIVSMEVTKPITNELSSLVTNTQENSTVLPEFAAFTDQVTTETRESESTDTYAIINRPMMPAVPTLAATTPILVDTGLSEAFINENEGNFANMELPTLGNAVHKGIMLTGTDEPTTIINLEASLTEVPFLVTKIQSYNDKKQDSALKLHVGSSTEQSAIINERLVVNKAGTINASAIINAKPMTNEFPSLEINTQSSAVSKLGQAFINEIKKNTATAKPPNIINTETMTMATTEIEDINRSTTGRTTVPPSKIQNSEVQKQDAALLAAGVALNVNAEQTIINGEIRERDTNTNVATDKSTIATSQEVSTVISNTQFITTETPLLMTMVQNPESNKRNESTVNDAITELPSTMNTENWTTNSQQNFAPENIFDFDTHAVNEEIITTETAYTPMTISYNLLIPEASEVISNKASLLTTQRPASGTDGAFNTEIVGKSPIIKQPYSTKEESVTADIAQNVESIIIPKTAILKKTITATKDANVISNVQPAPKDNKSTEGSLSPLENIVTKIGLTNSAIAKAAELSSEKKNQLSDNKVIPSAGYATAVKLKSDEYESAPANAIELNGNMEPTLGTTDRDLNITVLIAPSVQAVNISDKAMTNKAILNENHVKDNFNNVDLNNYKNVYNHTIETKIPNTQTSSGINVPKDLLLLQYNREHKSKLTNITIILGEPSGPKEESNDIADQNYFSQRSESEKILVTTNTNYSIVQPSIMERNNNNNAGSTNINHKESNLGGNFNQNSDYPRTSNEFIFQQPNMSSLNPDETSSREPIATVTQNYINMYTNLETNTVVSGRLDMVSSSTVVPTRAAVTDTKIVDASSKSTVLDVVHLPKNNLRIHPSGANKQVVSELTPAPQNVNIVQKKELHQSTTVNPRKQAINGVDITTAPTHGIQTLNTQTGVTNKANINPRNSQFSASIGNLQSEVQSKNNNIAKVSTFGDAHFNLPADIVARAEFLKSEQPVKEHIPIVKTKNSDNESILLHTEVRENNSSHNILSSISSDNIGVRSESVTEINNEIYKSNKKVPEDSTDNTVYQKRNSTLRNTSEPDLKQINVSTIYNLSPQTQNLYPSSKIRGSPQSVTSDSNLHFINNETAIPFTCINGIKGRFSDKDDCRKFYICIGKYRPIVGNCPENTVFSDFKKLCTKNLSHCIRQNEFKCPSVGRFSDFLKDNAYYICVNHRNHLYRFKFQCQKGYILNKTIVKCMETNEIESNELLSISSIDNSNQVDSISSSSGSTIPTNTNKNGINTRKTINTDDSSNKSEYSSKTEKSNETEKMEELEGNRRKIQEDDDEDEVFKCKKEGKFPIRNECRRYYLCKKRGSQYRRKVKKCESGSLFHKDKKKCVDADSYECE